MDHQSKQYNGYQIPDGDEDERVVANGTTEPAGPGQGGQDSGLGADSSSEHLKSILLNPFRPSTEIQTESATSAGEDLSSAKTDVQQQQQQQQQEKQPLRPHSKSAHPDPPPSQPDPQPPPLSQPLRPRSSSSPTSPSSPLPLSPTPGNPEGLKGILVNNDSPDDSNRYDSTANDHDHRHHQDNSLSPEKETESADVGEDDKVEKAVTFAEDIEVYDCKASTPITVSLDTPVCLIDPLVEAVGLVALTSGNSGNIDLPDTHGGVQLPVVAITALGAGSGPGTPEGYNNAELFATQSENKPDQQESPLISAPAENALDGDHPTVSRPSILNLDRERDRGGIKADGAGNSPAVVVPSGSSDAKTDSASPSLPMIAEDSTAATTTTSAGVAKVEQGSNHPTNTPAGTEEVETEQRIFSVLYCFLFLSPFLNACL